MPLLEAQTCFIVTSGWARLSTEAGLFYHVIIPIFVALTMTGYLVDVTDILLLKVS